MVPGSGDGVLPDQCVPVVKGLWSKVGYKGSKLEDIQKEIDKELVNADFAKFERQMLCNEILALKQKNDAVRYERDENYKRADKAQASLSQVMESDQRTFRTLMSEREQAKNFIQHAQRQANELVKEKEKEVESSKAISVKTAKATTEKTTSRPFNSGPPLSMGVTCLSWGLPAGPSTSYYPPPPAQLNPSPGSSTCAPRPKIGPPESNWKFETQQKLKAKMYERKAALDQSRLLQRDRVSLQDHVNAHKDPNRRIGEKPSEPRLIQSASPSYSGHQEQPRKKVVWHDPLIGSSSTPDKRY